MDGILVIDKPAGPTSHDVVARMRRRLGERHIGHTGTLDPAATGVLPLVVGRATRLARFLSSGDKAYDAVVRLGIATDTGDAAGTPIGEPFAGPMPARDDIDRALDPFRGTYLQQPPAYSAKKIEGRRSYAIARARKRAAAGPEVADGDGPRPSPALVTVHRAEIVDWVHDTLTLQLDVSAGFYVRSLAHDLGARLGTGAHLAALRRTRSGAFGLDRAIPLAEAERDAAAAQDAMIPMSRALSGLPVVVLAPEAVARAAHGCELGPADFVTGPPPAHVTAAGPDRAWIRLEDESGVLVGMAEPGSAPGALHPRIVLI